MGTRVRRLGNSAGILLSKSILRESKISESDEVNLSVIDGKIIVEKVQRQPRADWEEQLLQANALSDKEMLLNDTLPNDFDTEEWTW